VAVNECSSQRREVFFAGNVQGVGFRYTAQRVAAGYAVTGFVRNLRDGRVLMVLEGQAQQIDGFLASLQASLRGYVRGVTASEMAPTGEFSSFEIRF
jgi:acylphosphatase